MRPAGPLIEAHREGATTVRRSHDGVPHVGKPVALIVSRVRLSGRAVM